MEHEEIYKKARKLIDERELDDENMEEAHSDLADLIEEDANCDWAYGLLSEIYYWMGEYAEPQDKMFYFNEGVQYGEQGVEVNENSLESTFWLAANWGSYGQEKGIMKSLALVTPIKEACESVIDIDESYFYGGPWRILGRLYNKAPGFPFSIGDNTKSEECLLKAVELGPKFYLNHLFLAELYLSENHDSQAREHLEWILDAPLNKNHEREDGGYKEEARVLMRKMS